MWKILHLILPLIWSQGIAAAHYTILGDGMDFFKMCDESEFKGGDNLEELADINLVQDYADDMETVIVNGNITVKVDMDPKIPIGMDMEVYKWERGNWVNTIFSISRNDLCACLVAPTEIWYTFTNQLPKEDRLCPPRKGHVYQMRNLESRIELNNIGLYGDFTGKYKAIIQYKLDGYWLCMSFVANVWKA